MGLHDAARVYFPHREALRAWLLQHHADHPPFWLVYDKKSAGLAGSLTYDQIVEECLCFGWIDSLPGKVSETRTRVYVAPRKPRSVWSALNKQRVAKLTIAKALHPAGKAKIAEAKRDGSWNALNDADSLRTPKDLSQALRASPQAKRHFEAFPPGVRKNILTWIGMAKRPQTRAARIARTVELAARNVRAVGAARARDGS